MADEIRNGDSRMRVVRLLGHRDDARAWQIRDFLKRSVVEFQWVELSTEEDCRRKLGLSDLKSRPQTERADRLALRMGHEQSRVDQWHHQGPNREEQDLKLRPAGYEPHESMPGVQMEQCARPDLACGAACQESCRRLHAAGLIPNVLENTRVRWL